MLKKLSRLGTTLSSKELKEINGGFSSGCTSDCDCWYSYGGNLSYGYVCNFNTSHSSTGTCVPGIYIEPPCDF